MLNDTFEAGMSMKTKDQETQCPNRNRLIVPRFRHLRRIECYFAENCCFCTTVCQINSDFAGFSALDTARFAKDGPSGRSDCFQPASSHRNGGAGNPEPGSDRPCSKGRLDEKNVLEDRRPIAAASRSNFGTPSTILSLFRSIRKLHGRNLSWGRAGPGRCQWHRPRDTQLLESAASPRNRSCFRTQHTTPVARLQET